MSGSTTGGAGGHSDVELQAVIYILTCVVVATDTTIPPVPAQELS